MWRYDGGDIIFHLTFPVPSNHHIFQTPKPKEFHLTPYIPLTLVVCTSSFYMLEYSSPKQPLARNSEIMSLRMHFLKQINARVLTNGLPYREFNSRPSPPSPRTARIMMQQRSRLHARLRAICDEIVSSLQEIFTRSETKATS